MRPPVLLTTVLACTLVLGTGCTSGSDGPADAPGTDPSGTGAGPGAAPPPRAVLTRADAAAAVLSAPDAVTAAVQVSAALFDSSAVAVLVDATDAGSLPTATDRATDLGVPLLLTSAEAAAEPVAAELARLGSTDVLVVGAAARQAGRDAAAALTDLGVVTDPDELPRLADPAPAPGTTVLTTGGATDSAALATAAAAGAGVVTVSAGDPRGDPAAIRALSAAAPTRVVALGPAFGTAEALTARVAAAATGVELPGGGQLVLDGRRYVALYGHPGTPALGLLGEQDLAASVARARKLARSHQAHSEVPVVPAFELITTVASASAGPDGNYSTEVDPERLRPWIEEAGRQGVLVLLDLQPGRTDFLTQARRYETLLAYPHVSLALDPEWRLAADQRHLEQIGSVGAAEVNAVSQWLATSVRERRLPQKMLVLHQFRASMITDIAALETGYDELAVVVHADGNGTQGAKAATWSRVVEGAPAGVAFAWKNFVDEDSPMLTPAQTLAVRPTPVLITYQ